MTGPRIAPFSIATAPRRWRGASDRSALVGIAIVAALLAMILFALFERQAGPSGTASALLERGMSPGHHLLNREAGRTLPSNAPHIRRADMLVTQVSTRFRTSKDHVAELALNTRNLIAKEQPENVLDVLDAALFATDGLLPQTVPPLAPVLAAYAQARLGGASVPVARGVARSFVQVAADGRPAP